MEPVHDNEVDLKTILSEAADLPSLPLITQKILQLTFEPNASLAEISKLVAQDATLSVRFLKIVNSAYFGTVSDVHNIKQATAMLGIMAIRNIAITLSLFDVFPVRQSDSYKTLFKRSLTAAVAADFIAQVDGRKAPADVFLAGLIQNLGMFVLLYYLPEKYTRLLSTAEHYALGILDIEQCLLGTTHVKVGSIIGKQWDLPVIIRASLEYKQNISEALSLKIPDKAKLLIKSTYLGGLVADIFWGWNRAHTIALFRQELTYYFECDSNTADDILDSIPQLIQDSGFFAGDDFGAIPDYGEVKKLAERELRVAPLRQAELFNKNIDLQNKLAECEQELENTRAELDRSNQLVQKLALQLKS